MRKRAGEGAEMRESPAECERVGNYDIVYRNIGTNVT